MAKIQLAPFKQILSFLRRPSFKEQDASLLRDELLSINQLKYHAITLAKLHRIDFRTKPDKLLQRLADNERVISNCYLVISTFSTTSHKTTRKRSPAENWLLDNFYLIQQQFTQARRHLPRGYSKQLPIIMGGVSDGYPRIYDLALTLISHMDGRIDHDNATQFIAAYQSVEPLMLGELWAFPIMLQLALLENLRRVSVRIANMHEDKETAMLWADRMLAAAENEPKQLIQLLAKFADADIPLTAPFVEEFYARLQDQGASMTFVQTWVEQQLLLQNITATQLLELASRTAAANQISIANSISSLRFIAAMNWRNFVEEFSHVDQMLRNDPAGQYILQDFATRDRYRHAVEDVARLSTQNTRKLKLNQSGNHCAQTEIQAAKTVIELASVASNQLGNSNRQAHIGYYLIDDGLPTLKTKLNCRRSFTCRINRFCQTCSLALYIISILFFAGLFTIVVSFKLEDLNLNLGLDFTFASLTFLTSIGLAVSLVNIWITQTFRPHILPRLDFSKGIPDQHRTVVVVPTLIGSISEIDALLEAIEIRYLGNQDSNLYFALLTDFRDSTQSVMPEDSSLIEYIRKGIEALNTNYQTDRPSIFYLFHRKRSWNPIEQVWMGVERKRGKLEQFNTLLRSNDDALNRQTTFSQIVGNKALLKSFQYVITLDTDTQLPRDSAKQMIGNMAHCLNRPVYDEKIGRVVRGYAILQPRTSISLISASRTRFTQLNAGFAGIDPYTREVSDVYQDVFREGSFVGKGIYDVDAFRKSVEGRFPDDLILSHDLLEGGYARSALVSDIDLIEELPSSYLMDVSRRHRWIRGDWQLITWLVPTIFYSNEELKNPLNKLYKWKILDNLRRSLAHIVLFSLFAISMIFFEAKIAAVALAISLIILYSSPILDLLINTFKKSKEDSWYRHLNAVWQSSRNPFLVATLQLVFLPFEAAVDLDAIVKSAGRRLVTKRGLLQWHSPIYTKRNARNTCFEFYQEMWIAPAITLVLSIYLIVMFSISDNVQTTWLLYVPLFFAWLSSPALAWFISRPIVSKEAKLSSDQIAFLNVQAKLTWDYFARFVRAEDNWLPPDNVQTFPSETIASRTSPTNMGMGLLANLAAHDFGFINLEVLLDLTEKSITSMEKLTRYNGHFYNWYDTRTLQVLNPQYISSVDSGNLLGCLITLQSGFAELKSDDHESNQIQEAKIDDLHKRIGLLADMDFRFLYVEQTDLLSIGYDVGERKRDPSCYDLLASEARLASFILIANNQLPQKHWFSLGRLLTNTSSGAGLISWSGSMFEYLMPQLLMPNFDNTLLDQTGKVVVKTQMKYALQHQVPWGISESCYHLTDMAQTYQYRAFGIPGLGFKRGLADDLVIAPYATALALLVMPNEACQNLQLMADSGFVGQYGFYEAIDYTPIRLQRGKKYAVVQTFMAHHQGMSLLAYLSVLHNKPMQRRFMATPYLKAAELLLQERIPKLGSTLEPNVDEIICDDVNDAVSVGLMRVFKSPNTPTPEVHLLSNGRYHVMVTNAGGGYSHWHDLNVTRWREDATQDNWGSFIYCREEETQRLWSAAHQPTLHPADHYEAVFTQARAEYRRRDYGVETHTEISVSPEDDIEIRRVTLTNLTSRARQIEITSYAEVVLAPQNADLAHRAFSNLFVQTEILHDRQAIICTRRPRTENERVPWMFHLIATPGMVAGQSSFETDRSKFIGRGRTPANPVVFDTADVISRYDTNLFEHVSSQLSGQLFGKPISTSKNQLLSNTSGSVLDPIAAIRRTVTLATDRTTTLQIITGVASSREAAIALIDKYGDRHFVERAFEMAWFQSQEVLRMLNATESDAQIFGRLASAIIYCNPLRRAAPSLIARNNQGQSGLWRFGISGDLPIVLIRIADVGRINLVKQLLQAHAYWRMNGLVVDLVIINEDFSGYRAALQDSIIGLINAGPEAQTINKPGGVFIRRSDELSEEARVLFQSVARIVFTDNEESLIEQNERRVALDRATERTRDRLEPSLGIEHFPIVKSPNSPRIFKNGIGGFTPDGREYVMTINHQERSPASLSVTPMPWSNVIASPHIGTVVSESGGTYTWVENAHEFRLSTWHNDPITDASGEAHYIRDDETGAFWSPSPLPNCSTSNNIDYICRHGFGYSVFEHKAFGIDSELTTYVSMDAPVKIVVIKLKNNSKRARQLSIMGYSELVMGEWRHANMMQIVTEYDTESGAMLAKNAYGRECANRIVFAHVSEKNHSFTGNRTEFIGRNSALSSPAAMRRKRLSGKVGAGLDPCLGLQAQVILLENQERELVFVLGAAKHIDEIRGYIQKMGGVAGARQSLDAVHEYWNHILGAVQVETPDAALNVLANGWLIYQTISCRLWGRSGYYQSGGAYGFRDQLQDTMALVHTTPWLAREQIILCAQHQFPQGDVQHWWHPPSGQGVRTHFSDDYLWLAYATCRYVKATGDISILDEQIHFLEGRLLNPVEEAYYDLPQRSNETATLYEHCKRAIQHGLRFGIHQLPLIGCGDWNDGMNLIGKDGKGESVWLAWFLLDNLNSFNQVATQRGDVAFAETCHTHAVLLKINIESQAWDGEWYKRAFFDDGTPLGSKENDECQIDSISQSWSVLSRGGDTERAHQAMTAVNNRLVKRDAGLIKLLDPPFDQSHLAPGYIKGYVPGVRENGGQYTHAAIWATMAFAMQNDRERAWELFAMLNPINHASTADQVTTYQVEPYVMSADIYANAQHTGRGGWTWYTGAAGWMYRLTLETLLGITIQGNQLHIKPCVPTNWQSYKIHYRYRDTNYHITIHCESLLPNSVEKVVVLENDGVDHFVQV